MHSEKVKHVTTVDVVSAPPSKPIPHAMRGLTLTQEGGYSCPMAYCDGCGQEIKDISKAGVLWRYPKIKNGRSRFSILCKFRLSGALGCLSEPQHRLQPWMELSHYLMSLLYNMGVKTSKHVANLYEHADVVARFE